MQKSLKVSIFRLISMEWENAQKLLELNSPILYLYVAAVL